MVANAPAGAVGRGGITMGGGGGGAKTTGGGGGAAVPQAANVALTTAMAMILIFTMLDWIIFRVPLAILPGKLQMRSLTAPESRKLIIA